MPPIDVQELGPEKSDERAGRLKRLKASVAERRYDVNCDEVAQGMIHEGLLEIMLRDEVEGTGSLKQD